MIRNLQEPWKPVSRTHVIVGSVVLSALVLMKAFDSDGYLLLLDGANLLFHEAGHVFFGLFGTTLGLYGGTLGQLVFPAVTTSSFALRREPLSFAICAAWFFENLLNIAWYARDARSQLLPLVGGGDHDWTRIFRRWGMLQHDMTIANVIATIGWVGILATGGWLVSRYVRDARETV